MLYNALTAIILTITTASAQSGNGNYAEVNGLRMYYEIHGTGTPLVLLHGGGSTIESTYGRVLPLLASTHKVIAVELQAHGRTADRSTPLSFEQDADDVAALLKKLSIGKASIMGFSNGGTTALQFAIRHPEMTDKLILASALYSRDGMFAGFFDYMKGAKFEEMPQPLKDAYLATRPGDNKGLLTMFNRDVERMNNFRDVPEDAIKAVNAPVLVLNGDKDVILPAHAMRLSQLLPKARLAIVPSGHGDYIGEVCSPDKTGKMPEAVIVMIEEFLK